MPLSPTYTWSETDTTVKIVINNVPIKDQSQLFCSDRVVKLNAPPYFLLLDLRAAVDDDRSTATVVQGNKIVFQLKKTEPGLWGSLTAEGDKHIIKQQREQSVQRAHEKLVAAQRKRLERKQKEEKAAIDLQIAQERAQRARIEQLKQLELQQEREELEDWQNQHNNKQQLLETGDESDYEDDLQQGIQLAGEAAAAAGCLHDSRMSDHPDYYGRGWRPTRAQYNAVSAADSIGANERRNMQQDAVGSDSSSADTAAEHEEITITAADTADPVNRLSALGQMLSDAAAAVSAAAGEATNTHSSSSSCTAASSSDSEELLTPVHSSSTRTSNEPAGSTTTTAAAAAAVKRPSQASKPPAPVRCRAEPVTVTFTQLETAHLPAREQREVEFKQIKRQTKADSLDVSERQPAFLKDKGDGLAAQGNYRGAINAYSQALQLQPKQASLWANRAACHLALSQAQQCVQDCTAALELLQQTHLHLLQAAGLPDVQQEITAGILPPPAAPATAVAAAAAAAVSSGDIQASEGIDVAAYSSIVSVDDCECCSGDRSADAAVEAVTEATAAGQDGDASQQQALGSPTPLRQRPQQQQQLQGVGQVVPASSSTVLKVQRQLAKVLGRRAAAYVDLRQLQEARHDLQQALRWDPDNAQLQADALEVSAELNPTEILDAGILKQRADARFKGGDMQGAIEAYTAVIQLLRQQPGQRLEQQEQRQGERNASELEQQQKQSQRTQQLLAALSNRAACWLSLEKYSECVEDSTAGLLLVLDQAAAASTARGKAVEEQLDSTSSSAAAAAVAPAAASTCNDTELTAVSQLLDLLKRMAVGPRLPTLTDSCSPALIRSAARLLSRLAVACGCLKQPRLAGQCYDWAQQYWQAAGDDQRAAEMAADQQRLLQLMPAAESRSDLNGCGI